MIIEQEIDGFREPGHCEQIQDALNEVYAADRIVIYEWHTAPDTTHAGFYYPKEDIIGIWGGLNITRRIISTTSRMTAHPSNAMFIAETIQVE